MIHRLIARDSTAIRFDPAEAGESAEQLTGPRTALGGKRLEHGSDEIRQGGEKADLQGVRFEQQGMGSVYVLRKSWMAACRAPSTLHARRPLRTRVTPASQGRRRLCRRTAPIVQAMRRRQDRVPVSPATANGGGPPGSRLLDGWFGSAMKARCFFGQSGRCPVRPSFLAVDREPVEAPPYRCGLGFSPQRP